MLSIFITERGLHQALQNAGSAEVLGQEAMPNSGYCVLPLSRSQCIHVCSSVIRSDCLVRREESLLPVLHYFHPISLQEMLERSARN